MQPNEISVMFYLFGSIFLSVCPGALASSSLSSSSSGASAFSAASLIMFADLQFTNYKSTHKEVIYLSATHKEVIYLSAFRLQAMHESLM